MKISKAFSQAFQVRRREVSTRSPRLAPRWIRIPHPGYLLAVAAMATRCLCMSCICFPRRDARSNAGRQSLARSLVIDVKVRISIRRRVAGRKYA